MKHLAAVLVLSIFMATSAYSQEQTGFAGRPITSNLFAPTGNTLHAGEFTVGIGPVEYGITENLQIGTNLLLFIFQYYNADVKYSFIDTETRAFAAGLGVGHFNLNFRGIGGDASFTTLSPYIAYSMPVGPSTRLHLSANYTNFSSDVSIDDVEASATSAGTSVSGGIEHSLSNKTKFVGDLAYDLDFEGIRVGGGVLWGWETFRLKLGLQYFTPKNIGGLVLPYIGLWWRFDA
jgi:hypothetical protein